LNDSIYRGRGRASTFYGRARGIWPRVRGGSVIRSYKLDNRSSKLHIKDFPSDSIETLKTYFQVIKFYVHSIIICDDNDRLKLIVSLIYFQQFGEIESFVKVEEDKGIIVHFKNRKDAEQVNFEKE